MDAVRLELFRRRVPVYQYAREIGLSEHRLRRILAQRCKVRPGEMELILQPLGLSAADLIPAVEPRAA